MNLNLINLKPSEWSKEDWQTAYTEYCKTNMFGTKTKREYYEMVLENHKKLEEREKQLSPEIIQQWIRGRKAAALWAKEHGCDMNGRLIKDAQADTDNIRAKDLAERAENIATDTAQKLDYLISIAKQRRA